jgi:hypothetical protein
MNVLQNLIRRIEEKDQGLAGIIKELLNPISEEIIYGGNTTENIFGKIKESAESNIFNINLIPININGHCHKYCVSLASGKWNSRKNGFKGIVNRTNELWLKCGHKNRGTVILTSAWDEIDFNQNCRNIFDAQTNNQTKTVCVILVTANDIAMLYLK